MEYSAYLKVTSVNENINGPLTGGVLEGYSLVHAVDHLVHRLVDGATAAAERQHKHFVVTKPVDTASPGLIRAMIAEETLPTVTIDFWRAAPEGSAEQYYQVTLENVQIAGMKTEVLSTLRTETASHPPREKLSLRYQTITWEITAGGATYSESA